MLKPPKIPESVLVVIYTPELDVLIIERADRPGFWQSVTGSKDHLDEPLIETAVREVAEETHIEVSALEYIGSYLVDDWRYRNEIDKVMTTVFHASYVFGAIQPDDDIEELKWFKLNGKFDLASVVPAHKPLLSGVLEAFERSSKRRLKEGSNELPTEDR